MIKPGGRFDFEDGGSYLGGWLEGKAHGHGVCTGPKGQGEYAGAWVRGFEESGVYTWPSGNTYSGEWQDGKRHGVGVEIKGHWVYRGEWSHGYKGRYGTRQSTLSCAKYEGTWTTNLQDGYGIETYIDEGTYQGQWQKGMRHGFGIRQSAPYGIAAQYRDKDHLHSSMPSAINAHDTLTDAQHQRGRTPDPGQGITDRHRGGFVLTDRSVPGAGSNEGEQGRSRSTSIGRSLADRFRMRRGQSTGDLPQAVHQQQQKISPKAGGEQGRSLGGSGDTGQGILGPNVDITDPDTREVYLGEWKADKRSGFGVSERSDGLKYVGEWYNDKKHGYGVTTSKDGSKEEGKFKDNELITSGRKRKFFTMSKTRLRDRVDAAIVSATRSAEVAQQKALIAVTRKTNAKQKAEGSDKAAMKSLIDADLARDEAHRYSKELPHRPSPREAPVNPATRVRMLPGQDDLDRANPVPGGVPNDIGSLPSKSTRLLPPRQESSDSYNSNQSSSLGSSSVPTSPPPPKPPRSSPPEPTEEHPSSPPLNDIYPSRGRGGGTDTLSSGLESRIVARTNAPMYSSDPKGVASSHPTSLNRSSSTTGGNDGYPRIQGLGGSNAPGNRTDFDSGYQDRNQDFRQDSFRNFRSAHKLETGSINSYRDFSDSADSGPQTVTRNHLGDISTTSPRILLRPATPTNFPGPRENGSAPYHLNQGYQPREESRNRSQPTLVETGKPFSPVLSDRRYQIPVSDEYLGGETHGGVGVNNQGGDRDRRSEVTQQPRRSSLTRQSSTTVFPRMLPSQPPSSSFNDSHSIPDQHFSNPRHWSASQNQLHDYSSNLRTQPRVLEGQHHRRGMSSGNRTGPIVQQSLRRRETLPSIVRYAQTPSPAGTTSRAQVRSPDGHVYRPEEAKETFIVENGVRRRLIVKPPMAIYDRWQTAAEEKEPVVRLQRFTLEPATGPGGAGLSKHGVVKSSLPDVYRIRETTAAVPREQVFALSQQRRDELRKQKEETAKGTLIIRLTDITTWCRDNQLILILVALNLSLAALFLNFINHGNSSGSKN